MPVFESAMQERHDHHSKQSAGSLLLGVQTKLPQEHALDISPNNSLYTPMYEPVCVISRTGVVKPSRHEPKHLIVYAQ